MSGEPKVKACEDWLKTESNGTGFCARTAGQLENYLAAASERTVVHPRVTADTSSYIPPMSATCPGRLSVGTRVCDTPHCAWPD